jgi:hypothetical protein
MRRHPENLKPEQVPKLQRYLDANPAIKSLYEFKQYLMCTVKARVYSKHEARKLIPDLLKCIALLKDMELPQFSGHILPSGV